MTSNAPDQPKLLSKAVLVTLDGQIDLVDMEQYGARPGFDLSRTCLDKNGKTIQQLFKSHFIRVGAHAFILYAEKDYTKEGNK